MERRKSAAPRQIDWNELDKTKYYIFGPSLFLCVRAAVYPSNLVKTRLQAQGKNMLYSGTFDAFQKIIRTEGPLGLFKGFGANTLGVITGNIYITIYELTRQWYLTSTAWDPQYANFFSGGCASIMSQTVVMPLDIVSQQMMMADQGVNRNAAHRNVGILGVCQRIRASQGVRGFYRGYLPSVMTYAPSSAIWWGSYGWLYPWFYRHIPFSMRSETKTPIAQALGGGTAGLIAAVITNPMDVVRTRTQLYTQYNARETFHYLIQSEGPGGFMRGVTARMLAMGPSGVLIISTYELVKRLSKKV